MQKILSLIKKNVLLFIFIVFLLSDVIFILINNSLPQHLQDGGIQGLIILLNFIIFPVLFVTSLKFIISGLSGKNKPLDNNARNGCIIIAILGVLGILMISGAMTSLIF